MGHFDNMFQLSGLLLNLSSKEESGRRDDLVRIKEISLQIVKI